MIKETVFANAKIVTEDEVFTGAVAIRDGLIHALDQGSNIPAGAIDCEGDYLIPGLVELHTDNLEKHITPRPRVTWRAEEAVLAHDAQMTTAGITTVFDALSCGDVIYSSVRVEMLTAMAEAISKTQSRNHLRADHRIHLRCELSTPNLMDLFGAVVENPLVGVVSLMDHTPGQRQFRSEEHYRNYYMGKYNFSEEGMDEFTNRQMENSNLYAQAHRLKIVDVAHKKNLTLASHDDATSTHVEEALRLGVRFAEFPTTLEAAEKSRQGGMKILMGAPNLVRGGSHSGNIAAFDLIEADCLDILSSDYVPYSMLMGAFLMHDGALNVPLPKAIATVTSNPARMAGLDDRGAISVGKRADLVRAFHNDDATVVRSVWREGKRVA